MGFRKIKGIESEEIFETKVTDGTGRVLSKWKVLKEDFPNVIKILNDKFNMKLIVRRKDEFDRERKDKDLEWLK